MGQEALPLSKTKSKPSEAGSIWRGAAAQRVSFRACAEANDAQLAATTDARPLNSAAERCRVRPMLPPAGSGVCVPCAAGPTRRRSAGGEALCRGTSEVIQPCSPGNLKNGEGDRRGDIAKASWRPLDRLLARPPAAPGERGLLKSQKRRDTLSPTQEHRASSLFILLRVSAGSFNSVC